MNRAAPFFDGAFSRGLDIHTSSSRIGLAWIEWTYNGPQCIRSRVLDGETVVTDDRHLALDGCAPSSVKARFQHDGRLELFWTAFADGAERLFQTSSGSETSLVPPLAEQECGEIALTSNAEDDLWLAVQVWSRKQPRIELWRRTRHSWSHVDLSACHAGFAVHPAVMVCADETLVLVWSELGLGSSVIRGVTVGHHGSVAELDPLAFEGHFASHPALVADGPGAGYLACCVERLVKLDGGDANWHSRVVAAILDADAGRWRIDGESCIDYAMNPWRAGYAGRRRVPSLVAKPQGGAWVLFEEKLDPESMSPGLGRLVVRTVGGATEKVLLSGHNEYHVAAQPLVDGRIAAASLTQKLRYASVPPEYKLHRIDPETITETRPSGLGDNAGLSHFQVCATRPAHRPRDDDLQLFFGDPHLHSKLSGDLEGDQEQLYHFARDVAQLDFAVFTENDYAGFMSPMTAASWRRSRRNAEFFNDPGYFTTFVGWEYTLHRAPFSPEALNSHRSVIFPGSDGPLYCWLDPATGSAPDLVRHVRGKSVLLHHHHASGYDITDDTVERNIEVCSGWRNCMREQEFVRRLHELLNGGFRLGFIGASDNHERNPGLGGALTGVWAEANTRAAIYMAFLQRRVFATTGSRPDLRFRVGDVSMGGTGEVAQAPWVDVMVRCDVPVRSITVVRDGQRVHEQIYADRGEAHLRWRDTGSDSGGHWYYAHVTFAGEAAVLPWNRAPARGVDAWTSPVWVTQA